MVDQQLHNQQAFKNEQAEDEPKLKMCHRCKNFFSFAFGFLKKPAKRDNSTAQQRFTNVLRQRAWLILMISQTQELVLLLAKLVIPDVKFYWEQTLDQRLEPESRRHIYDVIAPIITVTIYAYTLLGTVLLVTSFKWSALRDYIIYYYLGYFMLYALIPYAETCSIHGWYSSYVASMTCFCFSVQQRNNFFAIIACIFVMSFGIEPLLTMELDAEWSIDTITTFGTIVMGVAVTLATIKLIETLQERVETQNSEYFNLVNRFREGVLILWKETASNPYEVLFHNKRASAILNERVDRETDRLGALFRSCHAQTEVTEGLQRKVFKPIKMDFLGTKTFEQAEEQQTEMKNLEQIIAENSSAAESTQKIDGQSIYKLIQAVAPPSSNDSPEEQFVQIRVESLQFQSKEATAVFFDDVSSYVNLMRMESKVLEAKNRQDSIQSYTATISHEYQTPISTCIMLLGTILEMDLPDHVKHLLQMILTQLRLMLNLVRDLLDVKMIQENRLADKIEIFKPMEVFNLVMETLKTQTTHAKIKLGFESLSAADLKDQPVSSYESFQRQHLPETLNGDKIRLTQVLTNLIKNAIKFTSNGFVQVYAAFDRELCRLVVHVVDSGKGIHSKEFPQLFIKFGKLLRTAQVNSEGIGLGLMISRSLVEHNKGQLQAHSEGIGKGSTFIFTMHMRLHGIEEEEVKSQLLGESSVLKEAPHADLDLSNSICDYEHSENSQRSQLLNPLTERKPNSSGRASSSVSSRQMADQSKQEANADKNLRKEEAEPAIGLRGKQKVFQRSKQDRFEEPSQILLIDNESINLLALCLLLKQFGLICHTSSTGAHAIERINKQLDEGLPIYKLILCDFQMGGIDGPSCTRIIRSNIDRAIAKEKAQGRSTVQHPFICCVSAYAKDLCGEQAIQSGMNYYLEKPIFKKHVMDLLARSGLIE